MQLLSLKKNIDDLDRMDRERRDVYEAIVNTIRVVGETTIRFDDEQASRHKARLIRLAEQLGSSPKELLGGVQREFAGHQTRFQSEAEEYIHALRANLSSTARLLQEMMANVDVRGSNHQTDLGQEIENLRSLQQLEDLAQLKLELGSISNRMSQSLEDLRREHQMMVAQMRDELQALHRELANRKMPSAPTAPQPVSQTPASTSPTYNGPPARVSAPPVPVVPNPAAPVPVAPVAASEAAPLSPASAEAPVAIAPAEPSDPRTNPAPANPERAEQSPRLVTPPAAPPEVTGGAHYPIPRMPDYILDSPGAELAALNTAIAPPTPAAAPQEQIGMRRRDLETMIRMKVESTETFCLMIVWLRNLPSLFNKHQPDVVLESMNSAARRLGKTLVGNPLWSKWEDDSFVVFVSQPKASAQKSSKEIAEKLNAVYTVDSSDGPVEVGLRVAVGVVDRTKDETADHLLGRAQQLIKNLRAMP
ncbi:MAG: hypothetical protein NTZ56_11180 [Acidobacteria bacterium]|nr:hypothetical protein [Acidobacteriota bacterium]